MGNEDNLLPVSLLLEDAPEASLGDWFAEPMDRTLAGTLLEKARQAMQRSIVIGQPGYELRILELITSYWLDRPVENLFTSLSAVLDNRYQRALLALVYGQLLMSRKQAGAMAHLDTGFRLASNILSAQDYFNLMQRHDLLRRLPVSTGQTRPQSLTALLAEANVIQQICGTGVREAIVGQKPDTLG